MTDARSIARSIARPHTVEQCTYGRTNERTNADAYSPTAATPSYVTRTRTYGFSPLAKEDQ